MPIKRVQLQLAIRMCGGDTVQHPEGAGTSDGIYGQSRALHLYRNGSAIHIHQHLAFRPHSVPGDPA